MTINKKMGRKSEMRHIIAGGLCVLALGFGTAAAAIGMSPVESENLAMRPLGQGTTLKINSVYGADDEDCIWVNRKTTSPSGKIKVSRKLECAQ
jgi:hypothetical protein